jgi:OmpA-OmpF porin, OOP family
MKTDKGKLIASIALMCAFLLAPGINSIVKAQLARNVEFEKDHPLAQVKTAGKDIFHHDEVNLTTNAVALNSAINGAFPELKPALTPNGGRLYFSRHLHPDNTHESDLEDIWFADYDVKTNKWSDPALLSGVLNNAGPNYVNNVSVSGDTVVLGNQYHKKGKMRAGLSYSVNINGNWSDPINIHIENDYNISEHANAFVSLKSGVIIQAIQRVETYGDRDLYVSFWNGHKATEPINMGTALNTEFEESSPFLDSDNKTLYFASKGHNGYGGYDIWVSERLDDTWTAWSEPRNLGPAINDGLDEEFFSITHCGNYAIFSKQVSVHNVDLYRIEIQELFTTPVRKNFPAPIDAKDSSLASL